MAIVNDHADCRHALSQDFRVLTLKELDPSGAIEMHAGPELDCVALMNANRADKESYCVVRAATA